ncbi:MAG: hypothetical protein GX330_07040 [Bacteroidales bacterium]|nr:hypothetical protein [Bacteroidales bacterium]
MKEPRFIKITIYLLLLLAPFTSFAQKEIDFRINLEKGACFEVESASLSESSAEVQENKVEYNMVIQYHIVKKTPDFYTLNFMYTERHSTIKIGMKEITTDPKTADMLDYLSPSTQIAMMMNKPFFAELTPKGKILAVKENKNIAKEFKAKTKKLSPALREQVYLMVNSMAKKESLIANIESWTSYIPDSAVKIGDKWIVEKDSTVTYYTFVTETDSTYIIEGLGSSENTITNEIQGMVMISNNKEEFTVTIEFDKQTFLPKIITKESESLIQVEMPDYPTFSRPPTRSQGKLTLKIRSCQ